jgi:RHS repeat-associated protein
LPNYTFTYNSRNQISSSTAGTFNYDGAGNVTTDSLNTYLYDAEGRLCAVVNSNSSYWQYVYDAEGNRVARGALAASISSCSGTPTYSKFQSGSLYLELVTGGNQVTELQYFTTTGAQWTHTNAFAGGLLATYASSASGYPFAFHMKDPLGTRRVLTDAVGKVLQSCQSLPYGNGESCTPTPTEQLFTQKERDTESGNDFFGARYYSSNFGRWISPDYSPNDGSIPDSILSGNINSPQSLNGYMYVMNNPLNHTDANGHDCVLQTRTSLSSETVTVTAGNCDNISAGDGQSKTYVPGTVDIGSITSDGSGGISLGFTPDSGGGGTADLKGAPIPDNPGIAYNWGNNAQGYQTLGTAGATVGSVRGVVTFYGASLSIAACVVGCPTAVAATIATIRGAVPLLPIVLPPGGKVAQMIARAGYQFYGNPAAFREYAQSLIDEATENGTAVVTDIGVVYRVGNTFLVVANRVLLSFVPNAEAGRGIVVKYFSNGGR